LEIIFAPRSIGAAHLRTYWFFLGLGRLGESFVRQGRGAQARCTLLTPESLLNADQNAQVETSKLTIRSIPLMNVKLSIFST
jgi:hypothetical protein